jgi:hypothetical protein
MDPKLVPFEFGNEKFGEAIYRAQLRLERERLERERKKEREMER